MDLKKETINEETANKETITVVPGTGVEPITTTFCQGDMVATVLDRVNLTLNEGTTVSIGRVRVKDIYTTEVKPGDCLVIAGKVSNG